MKLFVTGPTGSGKSTLARRVAKAAQIPLFPLDDMHWEPCEGGPDRRRDAASREALLARAVRSEAWVIEGVQFKWADQALENADTILVLDLPRWRNLVRIARRFVSRRLRGPRGGLNALRQEFGWSADYYDHEREMLFAKLAPWREKVVIARDNADAEAFLKR